MAMAAPALLALGSGGIPLGGFAFASGLSSALSAVSTIGTIGSILSPIMGGLSASSQAKSDAAIQERNAEIERRNAEQAKISAARSADETRAETARRVGGIKTAFGKAGVVSTAGSALLAQEEQAYEGELEAQKILFEGASTAAGYMNSSSIEKLRAKQSKSTAKSAIYKGILGAGSSLIK